MKRFIYTAIAAAFALTTVSCSDFLDKKSSAYDSDGFYQQEAGLDEAVTAIYRGLLYEQNWAVPAVMVQDMYCPYGLQDQENTTISAGPGLTPDQTYVNSYWKGHWAIVMRANNVLDGAATDLDAMSATYRRRVAEAKVLRAYAYYNLVMTFGDIPFFVHAVTPDEYDTPRSDKKEITDYLVNELQGIADSNILPWQPENIGRVGTGMVYNLIARFCLLAGSHDFGGEGQAYFKKAAEAAKVVMDKAGLAEKFGDLFCHEGQAKGQTRNEILFELPYARGQINLTHRTRYGHTSRTAGGSSVRFPSPLLEVCFECKDGKRIDESPLYDPKKPYLNRDPRMHQTMLMHGDTFVYNGGANKLILNVYGKTARQYPDPDSKRPAWYSGNNADVTLASSTFAKPGIGLLWNKYNMDLTESFNESTINIIVMRAAEAYLTYAEAKIELGELDQTVYDAINAVRRRAGAVDFDRAREGNQDLMRQQVRRERKMELAMEGVLLCDFRRWGIGDILNAGPIYGQPADEVRYTKLTKEDMPTFKKSARHDLNDVPDYSAVAEKYTKRDIRRFWAPRFQWWPIPRADLDRNPNLTNPEGY